jgi:hypothetical protein
MRFYEHIAAKIVDKITLDALTLDTFRAAKRLDGSEESRVEVGKQMVSICGNANIIAFLADYSVHQVILGIGYLTFIRERQKRRRMKKEASDNSNVDASDDEESEKHPIVKQSVTLMVSRGLGLVFTAAGGALGSMILPGWGTLLGSNMGDSLGSVVSEGSAALTS